MTCTTILQRASRRSREAKSGAAPVAALSRTRRHLMASDIADMSPEQLSKAMRNHVVSRGGLSKDEDGNPVLPNGAWAMMLYGSDLIEQQQARIADLEQEVELAAEALQAVVNILANDTRKTGDLLFDIHHAKDRAERALQAIKERADG